MKKRKINARLKSDFKAMEENIKSKQRKKRKK